MSSLTITSIAAAYLAIFFVGITIKTILGRMKNRIGIGDGNVLEMTRLIRAHANFAEYVPLTLILMILCELKAAHQDAIIAAAILLCVGRTIHYFGVIRVKEKLIFRQVGMVSTLFSILTLAVCLIEALL
jgi:uncharacterized protein